MKLKNSTKIYVLFIIICTISYMSIINFKIPNIPSVLASGETEDYVDIQSNVDGVADKGAHSNFAAQQATDWINDTLTEADQAPISGNSENFVDTNTSNVDGHVGHGTSSNFTAQQDSDVLYNDTLTETNTGGTPTTITNSPSATTGTWTNPTYAYADDSSYSYIVSATPSATQTYSGYGFSIPSDALITQVRVRYDAWSIGTAGLTSSKNPTANAGGTNPWANPTYAYTSDNSYATAVATIPTWRATGAMNHGTGAITVALPAGMSANDIVILVACCYTGGTIAITASGSITTWNALTGTPVDVALGDKLYVWWGRWSSGSTGPTLTPTSGDHIVGRTVAFYNCYTGGSPIDVSATGTETTSDVTFNFITGLTTTYNNEVCVCVCSTTYDPTFDSTSAFGTMTNGNLASINERMDNDINEGNGGGFGLDHGTLIINGAMGTFASTLAYASPKSYIAFALRSTVPNNTFDQIYGTFVITGSGTITKVEIGYEAYSSVAQQLDLYTSSNGGSTWNAIHTTANLGTSDPNAYTYIDVTSDTTWTWTLLNDANFKYKVVTHWLSGTPTWYVDALVVRITYTGVDDEQIRVDVSWDGGTSWSSKQTTGLSGTQATYWYDVTSVTSWTPAAVNQIQTRVDAYTVGDTGEVRLDWIPVEVTYTPANYELDYEFQWTTADSAQTSEYLCIRTYTFAGTAENLSVDVWTGTPATWVLVSAALTASQWNNISISSYLNQSTITFRFIGKTESSDSNQNTWIIECNLIHVWTVGVNYQLELEEEFTGANYARTNRELCIRMGAFSGAETLSVEWWNTTSSSWLTIIVSLTANTWNNISVTTYLTDFTFTIRFRDGTTSGDAIQNTWDKDSCLLHTWENTFALSLRVYDYDLTDVISGATVSMNNGTEYNSTSDINGWANYTGVSGSVNVRVLYFGFWVNGTFSVGMDSDKTIDVQCKLYDVTVLVQEGVQNAYLASANVTVYNSTSVQGNKITSGVTGNNGQVQLLNLPNNTLTFTQYGGASYSLVIGNTTQLVSSENQTITLTADQNNVNTNNSYSIIAFMNS